MKFKLTWRHGGVSWGWSHVRCSSGQCAWISICRRNTFVWIVAIDFQFAVFRSTRSPFARASAFCWRVLLISVGLFGIARIPWWISALLFGWTWLSWHWFATPTHIICRCEAPFVIWKCKIFRKLCKNATFGNLEFLIIFSLFFAWQVYFSMLQSG